MTRIALATVAPLATVPALATVAVLAVVAACGKDPVASRNKSDSAEEAAALVTRREDLAAELARQEQINREWPLHGLVTGLQIEVHKEPDPASPGIGWLRVGNRVRARGQGPNGEGVKTPTCATGWYELLPMGYVCAGEGVLVGAKAPAAEVEVPPPARSAALPYAYWFAKDDAVPEYHRPPSRDEQRDAAAFAERYLALRLKNPTLAEKLRRGELPSDMAKPAVLHRLIDRGSFVAGTGVEERAFRKFVRTVRGRYVKQVQLEPREGSAFEGVVLSDGAKLPIAWAVRGFTPAEKRTKADGTAKFVEDTTLAPVPRHAVVNGWLGRVNFGGTVYHRLAASAAGASGEAATERYVKDWFLAVAEPVARPREIRGTEPWVHIDISSQTLVAYEGDTPKFATLVSTGLPDFETPTGLFTIERKYVADTMANLGESMDNRYSIEDVPWTQYFKGSIALHGAFWHNGFGLPHSHGCVNLTPKDAHWLFSFLLPTVPEGWLGVVAALTKFPESRVLVTQ